MGIKIEAMVDNGMDGMPVEIECHITRGLPAMIIVGSASSMVNESKERIRNAILSCNMIFPRRRITLNLAPGDLPKTGTSLDLALAIAVLAASDQVPITATKDHLFIGELGLDGNIRAARGIIGRILAAKQVKNYVFVVPADNLPQVEYIPDIRVIPVSDLRQVVSYLTGLTSPVVATTSQFNQPVSKPSTDLNTIIGQEMAKRGLQIAASGGHNVLLFGPPGAGKTMLAKAFNSLMPPMSQAEILEVTHIHSLVVNRYDEVIGQRPFRAPHHSISHAAITGGGQHLRPGEISLSHHGVLFLDELPEFDRRSLEALRQPLEEHQISVVRASGTVVYPANFILIATSNPCPCGYYGSDTRSCRCTPQQIMNYQRKLSGPLMDRIDLFIPVESVSHYQLLDKAEAKSQDDIVESVNLARQHQAKRNVSGKLNGLLSTDELKSLAKLSPEAIQLLNKAADKLKLSSRSYLRTARISRTIADLASSSDVNQEHMSEALQFRYRPYNL